MDLARAFSYAFEDEDWQSKVPITLVIGIIPIVNLAVLGWGLDLVRNMLDGVRNPMPDWSDLGTQFSERWVAGLIAGIGWFIYYIPWLIVSVILNTISGAIFRGADNLGFLSISLGISCLVSLLGIIYAAAVWLPFSVGLMRYARTREFNHFLQFGRNLNIAMENLSTLLVLGIFMFVYGILLGIIGLIPCIGWLLVLFSIPISAIVQGHLVGQAAQEIAAKSRGAA